MLRQLPLNLDSKYVSLFVCDCASEVERARGLGVLWGCETSENPCKKGVTTTNICSYVECSVWSVMGVIGMVDQHGILPFFFVVGLALVVSWYVLRGGKDDGRR